MLSKQEIHFIKMCAESGLVHGCKLDTDKSKAERCVCSRYSDPVYQRGFREIVKERLWKTRA